MLILATTTLHPNTVLVCRTNLSNSNAGNKKQQDPPSIGNFQHLFGALKKDWHFLKNGVTKSVNWVNVSLKVPKIVKKVDDFVWLRTLEDPNAKHFQNPVWPQPSYQALSGVDLLFADLEALAAYGSYFYGMSKMWSRPLPEVYDAEVIANYFNCRPHIIALRLFEVFVAFSSALIKIRASSIRRVINSRTEEEKNANVSQYEFGKVLKDTMLNLGPTFIKVGQSLSTRPDIIGSEISKALSDLHDQIPPFPRTIAMKTIEDELGGPIDRLFRYVSDESVGAASFGQVYRGTTSDGHAVAIKVQRPDLHHLVARDIYILRLGLGLLRKIAKRKNDIRLYADELGKGLIGELDYRLEASNASRFLEAHLSFPFIRVPKIYPELTSKKVLTMEWIVGENPNDLLLASAEDNNSTYSDMQKIEAKQRLLDLVSKGVEASLVQLLETGFMHADPHPGNLRYTVSGQIGFLDFGLMCQMERKHQLAMLAAIIHIVNGDWASLVQAMSEMDVVTRGTNTRLLTMELETALGEVEFNDGMPDVKFSKVLGKILSITLKYQFRMPPYFTLLLRSLASLEGLAVAADKNFKTFEAAYPFVVRKLLTDNSPASRRILHSVILNRRREFQWQRLALFLRVGATRKRILAGSSTKVLESPGDGLTTSSSGSDNIFNVATFVLKLLSSKDGTVLRRLLFTADGKSLVRAYLSKEGSNVREQLCRAIADILYQWMSMTISKFPIGITPSSQTFESNSDYQLLLTDRRLKVVLRKVLNDARRDWSLMLHFSLSSFVMIVKASASACHRLFISLMEDKVKRISFSPIQVMASNLYVSLLGISAGYIKPM